MNFLKISGLCLAAVFIVVIFTQYKKEYAAIISVAVGGFILIICLNSVINPLYTLLEYMERVGVDSRYFSTALKTLAIGIITGFVSDTCRDFDSAAIAAKAELAGKICIFLICMPLLEELFTLITRLL